MALKPLGDAFISLLTMTIAPLIFLVVVTGIAQAGDIRSVGRIGARAFVYFEIGTTLCLLLGAVVAVVIHPGVGVAQPTRRASPLWRRNIPPCMSTISPVSSPT